MPRRNAFTVRRSIFFLSAFLLGGLAALVATLPPSPVPVSVAAAVDSTLAGRTLRGAFHVHTSRSDGAAAKAAVAASARAAGLQFVVFTDHGDGTRAPDPPEYLDGVLCVDGVEISTDGGHYIALGAAPSPYPLGGEPAAVVEDVARLGGFGVAAHPASRRPELAWADWTLGFDALEWLNADSEWRDERRTRLARAVLAYPFKPAGALATLLDRPDALARWDAAARGRRVLALAGHDAHGGIGRRLEDPSSRQYVPVPSYEASFRTFSLRVVLDRLPSGEPRPDGRALLQAIREGRLHTVVDAIAAGGAFAFAARTAVAVTGQGGVIEGNGPASFEAAAAVPAGARTIAFHNGGEIARSDGGVLRFSSGETGAFRVEVHVPGAPGDPPVPWLVSNPIFRLPPAAPATPAPLPATVAVPLRDAAWRIEKDPGSQGTVRTDAAAGEVTFEYALRDGARVSQFVALAADLPPDLPPYTAIAFDARAAATGRVSVQLRFARDADARWTKSVYLDATSRAITVPVDALRRADGPASRPDPRRATSLLVVVDLTNAKPGETGRVELKNARLVSR